MTPQAGLNVFHGEWDEDGVYFYQAYCDSIASWALEHQALGGPHFKPTRMTWIKPSLAWMLYRSGYGQKHGQTTVLKVKLPHSAVATLLSGSSCKQGGGGGWGRVQWDPARDLFMSEKAGQKRLPRKKTQRGIQMGLKGHLSELYVASIISIEDVTPLALMVKEAHSQKTEEEVRRAVAELIPLLPEEREYLPHCEESKLAELGMMA
eukprot:GFUD01068194.1.p1 GENE.GFUD01068194.1~~GFUD01068194.1.p1  ORF type:complete len:207 (-),score=54.33 GFUD01068194.1:407-1027(-)